MTFLIGNLITRVRNKRKEVTQSGRYRNHGIVLGKKRGCHKRNGCRYGRKLNTLAKNILLSREDAEESVSDTYMETWKTIPPHRPKYFFAFLASICRHLSLNRLDWNMAAKRKAEVVLLTEEMELCIPDTSLERTMRGKELGRILDAFLESLPKDSRLIFLRRYWYVDTIAEIAQRYGMTESKVKMQLSRTKEKLRTYLEKEEISV